MIGLPGQTHEQLADDLLFFRREGVDMIRMGPWLPHQAAPLGQGTELTPTFCARQLGLCLRMIATARLLLPTCFQETYDRALYPTLHPIGPKHDFAWRLGTQLRAGRAGFRTLGLAFLMGLRDWHSEAEALAAHARMLMKTCWQARIQFAFPRIRPVDGGFIPAAPVDDETLERLMLAFRIAFPEASITLSTREAPAFRDHMAELCADTLSAGSHVTPGGYAHPTDQTAQFSLADTRSAADVIAALRARHLDPVFKQWA